MKILVIAQPRSKSMWLNSMLASHYRLRNLKEPYGLTNEKAVLRNDLGEWVKNVFRISEELAEKNNTVVKLQTSSLYWNNKWFGLKPFNLPDYDMIYTLRRRNRVDAVCSAFLAQDLYKWHYLETPTTEIMPKTLDFNRDYQLLSDAVRDDLALDRVEQELTNYQPLEYETLNTWVESNLTDGESHLVESKYNYSKWFTNYNNIQTYLDHIKDSVCLK